MFFSYYQLMHKNIISKNTFFYTVGQSLCYGGHLLPLFLLLGNKSSNRELCSWIECHYYWNFWNFVSQTGLLSFFVVLLCHLLSFLYPKNGKKPSCKEIQKLKNKREKRRGEQEERINGFLQMLPKTFMKWLIVHTKTFCVLLHHHQNHHRHIPVYQCTLLVHQCCFKFCGKHLMPNQCAYGVTCEWCVYSAA